MRKPNRVRHPPTAMTDLARQTSRKIHQHRPNQSTHAHAWEYEGAHRACTPSATHHDILESSPRLMEIFTAAVLERSKSRESRREAVRAVRMGPTAARIADPKARPVRETKHPHTRSSNKKRCSTTASHITLLMKHWRRRLVGSKRAQILNWPP